MGKYSKRDGNTTIMSAILDVQCFVLPLSVTASCLGGLCNLSFDIYRVLHWEHSIFHELIKMKLNKSTAINVTNKSAFLSFLKYDSYIHSIHSGGNLYRCY